MIVTAVYLAATGGDGSDPWKVLGNSGDERLAIATLADLALSRALEVAPGSDDESPAARRLTVVGPVPATGLLGTAVRELAGVTRQLDIDRAVRALRNLSTAVEAELVAAGDLVEQGRRGLLKKHTVYAARPERVDDARGRIRDADPSRAEERALALIATAGLPDKRLQQLTAGPLNPQAAALDPFDAFDASATAPDGAPIGKNGADLLTALVTVLTATSDTTHWTDL